MGQRIFYIAAKGDLEVPIDIVSFIEKNSTIIPLDIDEDVYRAFGELCQDLETLDDLYNALPGFSPKVFDFLRSIQLQNFAILGLREFADVPHFIGNPIVYINGKIVKVEENDPQIGHTLLGIDFSFHELIKKEDRYWSYANAETDYFTIIENLLPPKWYVMD